LEKTLEGAPEKRPYKGAQKPNKKEMFLMLELIKTYVM
jgi:hypothetical protein